MTARGAARDRHQSCEKKYCGYIGTLRGKFPDNMALAMRDEDVDPKRDERAILCSRRHLAEECSEQYCARDAKRNPERSGGQDKEPASWGVQTVDSIAKNLRRAESP
jgi:hypothetical protein